MKWLTAAAATLTAALWAAQRYNATPAPAQPGTSYEPEPEQIADTLDTIMTAIDPSTYAAAPDSAPANERAFLDMIAAAEGTSGPDGYRAMFGYPAPDRIAPNLQDHPRRYFSFTNSRGETLRTSAAGRYQFLVKTWDTLKNRLSLPDFGPASQDAAALELIRERGALGDVRAGRIADAITKIAPVWASMPGAGYAQPERKLSFLFSSYANSGGTFEA